MHKTHNYLGNNVDTARQNVIMQLVVCRRRFTLTSNARQLIRVLEATCNIF